MRSQHHGKKKKVRKKFSPTTTYTNSLCTVLSYSHTQTHTVSAISCFLAARRANTANKGDRAREENTNQKREDEKRGGFVQTTAEQSSPRDETSVADVGQRGAKGYTRCREGGKDSKCEVLKRRGSWIETGRLLSG